MGLRLEIPDYALCKHTGKGRERGRGWEHWFTEGCKLVPPPQEEFETYRTEAEDAWIKRGSTQLDVGGKKSLRDPNWDEVTSEQPLFPRYQLIEGADEDENWPTDGSDCGLAYEPVTPTRRTHR